MPEATTQHPEGAKQETTDMAEAAALFLKGREEFHASMKTFGDVTAELKNNLKAIQQQLEIHETKSKRPAIVRPGDEGLTDVQIAQKDAFYKSLRSGRDSLDVEERKLLQVADDAGAGFLAPAQLLMEIIKDTPEYSPVRSVARVRQTAGKSIQLPKRTGTPSAQWVGEGGTVTNTNAKYGLEEIPCHPLVAMTYATFEMLEDAATNMASELQFDGAEQFGVAEGAAFVSGDGKNKPQGFLTPASVTDLYVPSGDATHITADALIRAFYALKSWYANAATWAMHRLTLREVRLLKDGNDRYVWDPNLDRGRAPTILERPYIECTDMAAPSDAGAYTTGDFPIVLADFMRGYVVIDRTQMAVQRDDTTLADQGLVRFIMRRRVGGQVVLPAAFRPIKVATS